MVDAEKRNKRQYAWQTENRERINILFDKGTKARIEATGAKVSEFIREAVEEKLQKIEK